MTGPSKPLWHRLLCGNTTGTKLKLLSTLLHAVVPFNRPHRVTLSKLEERAVEVRLPLRRSNMNHLRGLHACALATAGEYATGLLLLRKIDPARYRLIMKSISVKYGRQGRSEALARAELSDERLEREILTPLRSADEAEIPLEATLRDREGRELCVATVLWQIKSWEAVRKARA